MAKLRKMLGGADSPYIASLMRLIETQSKATIAKWCLDYAQANILPIFERRCPGDGRPRMALDASRDWFEGRKKLAEVKSIILNECHAAARELEANPAAQAAARACGQAAACFHTPTHSLGLAFYGAAAIAYDRVGTGESAEVYDRVNHLPFLVCYTLLNVQQAGGIQASLKVALQVACSILRLSILMIQYIVLSIGKSLIFAQSSQIMIESIIPCGIILVRW